MKYIDNYLNNINMYQLVQYGLFILAGLGIALAFAGILPMNGIHMLISFLIILISSALSNFLFSWIFKVPTNNESFSITAVILFLILSPATSIASSLLLAIAGIAAMASKFVLAAYRRHIFNPAAGAAMLVGISGITAATWWVGSAAMLPAVIILGFLVARKTRRLTMFAIFALTAITAILFSNWQGLNGLNDLLKTTIISGPVIFFGTIMLTEPLTLPPTRKLQIVYAVLAGALFGTPFNIGPIYNTPEFSLLLANIFSYIVSPKKKLILTLKGKVQMAPLVWDFIFTSSDKMRFHAGQYLEWTLAHSSDTRGIRRYFTIASSPTEEEIHLGVKIPEESSSFKKALLSMNPGDELLAGQLSGDFILPAKNQKLVGIAGGIGVTPFRSMVKYLTDTNRTTDMVLFYASANHEEFVYDEVLSDGSKVGVKTVQILSGAKDIPKNWAGKIGFITKEMIEEDVPDYKNRLYYLSGPNVMVDAYKKLLKSMGVRRSQIITDYFPGY